MIDSSDIQELLEQEPFPSFRIRMADGKLYDIADPALVVPMENSLFMAFPKRDRWKILSYQNMTSIEVPAPA
jgi:hypothetical protein